MITNGTIIVIARSGLCARCQTVYLTTFYESDKFVTHVYFIKPPKTLEHS